MPLSSSSSSSFRASSSGDSLAGPTSSQGARRTREECSSVGHSANQLQSLWRRLKEMCWQRRHALQRRSHAACALLQLASSLPCSSHEPLTPFWQSPSEWRCAHQRSQSCCIEWALQFCCKAFCTALTFQK